MVMHNVAMVSCNDEKVRFYSFEPRFKPDLEYATEVLLLASHHTLHSLPPLLPPSHASSLSQTNAHTQHAKILLTYHLPWFRTPASAFIGKPTRSTSCALTRPRKCMGRAAVLSPCTVSLLNSGRMRCVTMCAHPLALVSVRDKKRVCCIEGATVEGERSGVGKLGA